jgi:hypothetical protein
MRNGRACPCARCWSGPSLQKMFARSCSNYVTSPLSETAPDLADFQSRHGRRFTFRGKGREIAPVYAGWDDTKVVQPDGLRASSRGVEGWILTSLAGGSDDPPQKLGPPPAPLWFF